MSSTRKIQATKNYRLFGRSAENRPLDLKKHKRLLESMKKYGFIPSYPIIVYRGTDGNLILKDGQHRLAIAETLGLTVYWTEEAIDFDVAEINSTPKGWQLRDYAQKHQANGLKVYQEGLDFADHYGLKIGVAFALLGGVTGYTAIARPFIEGRFKIKDRPWAEQVAGIYKPLADMKAALNNSRFLEACMAVCRVPEFDKTRLLECAERCRDKLQPYSTRDAYLDMLEEVYNFGRKRLVGLKAAAITAMRSRNAAVKKKADAAARKAGEAAA